MDVAFVLHGVRSRALLSLRQLAALAHTSHATLAAYEAGRVDPGGATVGRVARAAGYEVEPVLVRALPDPAERGRELMDVLDLAEQFPARHAATLQCPVFGRSNSPAAGHA